MTSLSEFRALALAMPEAVEGSHFDNADFRVGGKIFATLRESDRRAVVKLTPDDQQLLTATMPGRVKPVPGKWGSKGWSQLDLDALDTAEVRHLLAFAWRSVAPKRLLKT